MKLRKIVASKLILDWSPEQISGWLKTQYPEDESLRVSILLRAQRPSRQTAFCPLHRFDNNLTTR